MTWVTITICIVLGVAVWVAAMSLGARLMFRADPGDGSAGLAILAGGLRWFGVRWGLRSVPTGLRKAGFAGKFVYWKWHEAWRGWLVIPALRNRSLIERHAARIAACITEYIRTHPGAPVYVLGCSGGGFVALRALELLGDDVQVASAALLSAAFDPRRDLAAALSHTRGPLVVTASPLDFIVLGAGTLLFGNPDGRHCAGVGMKGPADAASDKLVCIRWRPAMILSGRLGGHPSATPPAFIARYVAPVMGIRPKLLRAPKTPSQA